MPRTGTVTVLFTDLVGSTRLATQLGQEDYEEFRRDHFRRLRRAVATHGGVEVKNTGDGLMVRFASAASAVGCAVGLQQAADHQARRAKTLPIAIRVGVSAGEATEDENDLFGPPVVEAARLCDAAASGQILVADVVRSLARGSGHPFRNVGSLELKGLAEPLPTCEVPWEPLPEEVAQLPLPSLLAREEQFVLAGRDAEAGAMRAAFERACGGERTTVLLAGEPGIGKTRLAAETARAAHDEGAIVLFGRCDEDLGVPFQPFVEALRHYVTHRHADSHQQAQLGRHPGELVRLVPELATRWPDLPPPMQSDGETERYRLFDAVATWLAEAAATKPLLLIVDDLHWGARPTLLLLKHVLRSIAQAQLMIVATLRDTELEPAVSELLADLRRESQVERIDLRGLSSSAVIAMLEHASGHALDDRARSLAEGVTGETAGNPFFIGEIVRHFVEGGSVVQGESGWRAAGEAAISIPQGVREVVQRRLGRLAQETQQALTLASVVGRDFDLEVLDSLVDGDEDALIEGLESAVRARLVEEAGVGRYRFAHALVRTTLYEAISATRRVRLHQRVAQCIEQSRPDDVTALAHQFAQAASNGKGLDKAIEYARRAGDRALDSLAHDQAMVFYGQALALLAQSRREGAREHAELLLRLGESQRRAGAAAHRDTLLEAARLSHRIGEKDLLVRAALANNRWWTSAVGVVDQERVEMLEAAIAAGSGDTTERASLLAILGVELIYAGDRRRREALSDDALAMARRVGDPATLAHVLHCRFTTIWGPHNIADRFAMSGEAGEVCTALSDPVPSFFAHTSRATAAMEMGDFAEVDRCVERMRSIADDLGQPTLQWVATYYRGGRAQMAGRCVEAEMEAWQAFEIARVSGQPDGAQHFGGQLFMIRYDQGRLAELEEAVLRSAIVPERPKAHYPAILLVHCIMDRCDEARALIERDPAYDFSTVPDDPLWLSGVVNYAEVYRQLDLADHAARLYERLLPFRNRFAANGPGTWGAVDYYLGGLATAMRRFDAAEEHFAEAVTLHERASMPVYRARTQLAWARMLQRRDRPADVHLAHSLASEAREVGRTLGCAGIERDAASFL